MGELNGGEFLLDYAIVAVSVFNTIVLLWLGLTVLLNSERRTGWHWAAGGSLLIGGAIFAIHTAVLGQGLGYTGFWLALWYRLGWLPALGAPFIWYVVILWYTGYWDSRDNPLRRRQRWAYAFVSMLVLALALLVTVSDLLPVISRGAQHFAEQIPLLRSIPLRGLIYPPYIILCVSLSLSALRRPSPSSRVMGELARRRARPWLVGASLLLLAVSLVVASGMLWFVGDARSQLLYDVDKGMPIGQAWLEVITSVSGLPYALALLDLLINALIAVALLMLGQAVATYEVFTGKTLPRRGLLRQWRSTVVLAAVYSAAAGASLIPGLHPIYTLLVATVLLTVFYAFYNWRTYAERDRYISQLRPFVSGPRLYGDLLAGSADGAPGAGVESTFRALCADVLNTKVAYLAAVGALSSLAGPPLRYPKDITPPLPLTEVALLFGSPGTIAAPVEPERYGGAQWAVPLWSERGLVGVLLLGEKRDGGLYTQEEIEIGRATGERIVDTMASTEMARRLMALQRQRLAESQVLDRRTRRVLHDDALPRLHAAMLMLSSGSDAKTSANGLALLADVHRQISDLLREMPSATAPEVGKLGLLGALRAAVEGELAGAFDRVQWEITPDGEAAAAEVAPLAAEVAFYAAREAIRNAARHARDGDLARPLRLLVAVRHRDGLEIVIEDDGAGMTPGAGRNGGSGQGLALHGTMMAVVGGSLAADSVPGKYTRVTLALPETALIRQ